MSDTIRFDMLPAYIMHNPMLACVQVCEESIDVWVPLTRKERLINWVGRKLIEFGEG